VSYFFYGILIVYNKLSLSREKIEERNDGHMRSMKGEYRWRVKDWNVQNEENISLACGRRWSGSKCCGAAK